MSEPTKHHYVPEVYLSRFSLNSNGDLYTLKVKSEFKEKIKNKNKSQICYTIDGYKFDNNEIIKQFNIQDNNIIEKTAFLYENSKLKILFDKIDYFNSLTKSEFRDLLNIILDVKARNPVFSDNIKKINTSSKYFDNRLNGLKYLSKKLCEKYGLDPKIVDNVQKDVKQKFANQNYKLNVHKSNFLNPHPVREELLDKLVNWDAIILYTEYNNPFITSDNPGFTIQPDNKILNMEFGKVNRFIFPISPKCSLALFKNDKKTLNIYKELQFKKATLRMIQDINKGTLINSHELIIGSLKEQLLITQKIMN